MYRRRAIHLDAMRFAKSTQVKLDEINYRIEQDKKRILMLNRFEKIKVWNELREIRRVFVPSYIPGESSSPEQARSHSSFKADESSSKTPGSKQSDSTQSNSTTLPLNNNVPKSYISEKVNRLDNGQQLTPDESHDLNSGPLRIRKQKNSTRERKMSLPSTPLRIRESVSKTTSSSTNDKDFASNENKLVENSVRDQRKTSWDVSSLRKISENGNCSRRRSDSNPPALGNEDACSPNSVVAKVRTTSKTESHSSLGQCGVKSPSNSMLSVACGYMAFKKLLRNKRHNDSFVSPRFRKQSEGDEAIASNSAFLRSKSAVIKPNTANVTRQRMAWNGVELSPTEDETSSFDNNDPKKRSSESALSSVQIKDQPRARKLRPGWNQIIDKGQIEFSKWFGGSKVHIDERKSATSTSKLKLGVEGEWREECKSIKKTVAWTANDAQTMKSLTS